MTWIYLTGEYAGTYERFEVERAVFREDRELAIDCNCAGPGEEPFIYTITFRREDPLFFRGEWVAGKAVEREAGTCSCRVYFNAGRLALVGVWKEAGYTDQWYAELSPVEDVGDEDR